MNEYVHAYDFKDSNGASMNIRFWYNDTNSLQGGTTTPPNTLRLAKGLNLATNAWLNNAVGSVIPGSILEWVSDMPKLATKLSVDFGSLLGPIFFLWVLELLLPFMLQALVFEKESGLRIMMKMHGLDNTAYITVTYLYYLVLYILYFLLLMFFGAITKLQFVLLNNGGIQFLHYFLHGNLQIALAFFLSSFFRSPKTAAVAGYLWVFISGFITNFLLVNFIQMGYSWVWALELIPGFSLYRGLYEFSQYAFRGSYQGTKGMTPANLKDSGNGALAPPLASLFECKTHLLTPLS